MTWTFTDPGADSTYGLEKWSVVNGVPTVGTDFLRGTHTKCIKFPVNSQANLLSPNGVVADAGSRIVFGIYINALPSTARTIFLVRTAAAASVWSLGITAAGVMQLTGTGQIGSDGATLAVGQYYQITIANTITSTVVNRFEVFVHNAAGVAMTGISVTNGTLPTTGQSNIRLGCVVADTTFDFRYSDIGADDSNSLADIAPLVYITPKRPFANGTLNQLTTQIGAGGSGYGSGRSPQVNELPLSTTNGWSRAGTGGPWTEEYTVEGLAVGAVNLTGLTLLGSRAWVYAKAAASITGQIVADGVSSNISLTTTNTMFTAPIAGTAFPSGAAAVGIVTDTSANLVSLFECGVDIAYNPMSLTMSFTQQPTTTAAGVAISPAPTVQLSDNAAGQTVTIAKGTGGMAFTSGSTLTAVTNGSGLATFSNLVPTTGSAGANTLAATCPTYTGVTSNSYTITNARASVLIAFEAANGGAGAFPIGYDFATNCTDSGSGTASALAPVIAGQGTTWVQATGSKMPAITGSGLVFSAASLQHMIAPLNTALALSGAAGLHFYFFGFSPTANKVSIFGVAPDVTDATSKPNLWLGSNATEYIMRTNPLSTDVDVTRTTSGLIGSVPRTLSVGREGTHPALSAGGASAGDYCFKCEVGGLMWKYALNLTQPSVTAPGLQLSLARNGTDYSDVTFLGLIGTTQVESAAFMQNLYAYASSMYSGISLDHSLTRQDKEHGTSTDRAHGSTHPIGSIIAGEDGTTSAQDICAKIVPTWASIGRESSVFVHECSNGMLLSDQVALVAERFALETVTGQSGNLVYGIGGLLGMNNSVYNGTTVGVNDPTAYLTYLAAFVSTLNGLGAKIYARTVMDYPGAAGGVGSFYTPSNDASGVVNQFGINMKAFCALLRGAGFLALPGVVGLLEFEHQAGTHGEIDRASPATSPAGTFNKAAFDTYYLNTTGHPTDVEQNIMGVIKRGFLDANPSILGGNIGATFFARSRRGGRRSALV